MNQHPLRPGNYGKFNREPSRTESVSNANDSQPEPVIRLDPEAEEFVYQPSQPTFNPIHQPVQYYPVVLVPAPLPQASFQWISQDVQSNTPSKTPQEFVDDDEETSDESDGDTGKLLSNTRFVYLLDDLLGFRARPLCQSRPSEVNFTELLGDPLTIRQTIELVFDPQKVFRRKTQVILNKFVPEKFDLFARLLTELLDECVSCYKHLGIVLDFILDIGMDQRGFAEQYVELLKYLSKHMEGMVSKWEWVRDSGLKPHSIVKDIVRKQCKNKHRSYWVSVALNKEFMRDVVFDSGWDVPLFICDRICKFVQDDTDMECTKKKFIGVEKIVGELCKEKMISRRMVCIEIINPLLHLTNDDDDSSSTWQSPVTAVELEAVCKLLSVCGQLLEGKRPELLDEYFRVLDEGTNGLNKRMEFMVMDLSDLRKTGWGNADESVFVPAPTAHWQSPTRMGRSCGHGSISRVGRGLSRMRAPNARYLAG